jgi:hypothetical protein
LNEISLEAKKKGSALVDSKVHIQQAADMLKKKLSGTLKIKPGRRQKMDYWEITKHFHIAFKRYLSGRVVLQIRIA